jgi:ribosomal protein L34E
MPERRGYGRCPKCGQKHPKTSRERRVDGFTTCGACGYRLKSVLWDRFHESRSSGAREEREAVLRYLKKCASRDWYGANACSAMAEDIEALVHIQGS